MDLFHDGGAWFERRNDNTDCCCFLICFDRPVMATFDQPHASSDGGAVLLKAADQRLGLLERPHGDRSPTRARRRGVTHGVSDLIAQRVFAIAVWPSRWQLTLTEPTIRSTNCCWGATRSRASRLASQPTISRFERTCGPADAARHERRARRPGAGPPSPPSDGGARLITIDLDVTEDETHEQRSNSPSSMASMITGATCHSWRA